MDKTAQGFARKIIDELAAIRRLVHDAISIPLGEHHKTDQHQDKSTKGENKIPPITATPPPETTPADTSYNQSAKKENLCLKWSNEWKPIFELFGIAVLVIYTTLTYLSWRAMKEANGITVKSLEVSQRAFVYAEDPVLGGAGRKPLTRSGHSYWLAMNLMNSGETPARKAKVQANFCATNGLIGPDFGWTPAPGGSSPEMLIAPKKGGQIGLEIQEPTLIDVETGRLHLLVYGTVNYQDIFGKEHKTDFCFDYRGFALNGNGEIKNLIWAACPVHTCYDGDCPEIIGKAPCPGICGQLGTSTIQPH